MNRRKLKPMVELYPGALAGTDDVASLHDHAGGQAEKAVAALSQLHSNGELGGVTHRRKAVAS